MPTCWHSFETDIDSGAIRPGRVPADDEERVMNSNLLAVTAMLLCGLALSDRASAETPFDHINATTAQSDVTTTALRGGVSALMGSGGNIAVLSGPEGKFMVDTGIAVSEQKLTAALTAIGPQGVKYAVNTHWHWDHTDGNLWVHNGGATIIASPMTLQHLSSTIRVEEWQHAFPPVPPGARPTILVRSKTSRMLDGEQIVIAPYPASHTDGDLYVYFEHADILVTGDTFWNGMYPFIDYVGGGGIDGMIVAANENIALASNHTIVIPGHGPVGNKSDLIKFRDMLVQARSNVAELKREGKTLQQVIASDPTSKFDATWGRSIISPAIFTQLVYRGIGRRTASD
jgi:glyoxylase-like metal-dependent hydrolase (beta-lactamase superfamily II)